VKTYVSAVFQVLDRFNKLAVGPAQVLFYYNGHRIKPIYKSGGYFVFTDLPQGKASFRLTSPIYEQEILDVEIPAAGFGYVDRLLILNPARNYPFGREVTLLAGQIRQKGKNLSHARIHLAMDNAKEIMKIAQDNTEPGARQIKMFLAVPEHRVPLPGQYLIKDKNDGKREVCVITNASGEGIYHLDKGLKYGHARGTPLVEITGCLTGPDGTFFAAIPDIPEEKTKFEILAYGSDDQIYKQEVEIIANKENLLQVIEVV